MLNSETNRVAIGVEEFNKSTIYITETTMDTSGYVLKYLAYSSLCITADILDKILSFISDKKPGASSLISMTIH